MQTVINVGFGVAVGVVLALIGPPHAILWEMATIILRFLPFISCDWIGPSDKTPDASEKAALDAVVRRARGNGDTRSRSAAR